MSPRTPAWLTADEVAERLGLSLATVYEEIHAGRLPAQRYGRSYLVRRADVQGRVADTAAAAG
jgi:excisionase family DNA binding protein